MQINISQEAVSAAASIEDALMQRATIEHLNGRVVELRAIQGELIKLLEKHEIDWQAELDSSKKKRKQPQDRKPGRAPAKKAAPSSRGSRT